MSALRGTRLEIARQRIMRAAENETITGIAMECGFFHLGRFSSAYSQAFGEAPSQTMRRSRSVRTRD
jgi:transcriptional regulator GlxA family with amidase domain